MKVSTPVAIALVTEDELGMVVAQRVIAASHRPFVIGRRVVARGFGNIKRSIDKYRQASRTMPHVVLTDLDRTVCPARLRADWRAIELPSAMLLCVAVRETEAWLLGDRQGFARFATIGIGRLPPQPESLPDPKECLVELVKRSRNRALARDLTPARGSPLPHGPLYGERLAAFAEREWDIDAASHRCPSLRRMRQRLEIFPQ